MVAEIISEVCKAAHAGTLAFFVGAGISKPSGLPTSAEIIDLCVKHLIDEKTYELSCSKSFPKDFGRSLRLEYFCQCLAEVNDNVRLLPLKFLAGGQPSCLHYLIASCAKGGHVTTIVTTNFDLLIERALDDLNVPYRILCTEDDFACFSLDTNCITLIKIHGSLDSQSYEPLPGILADIRSVGKGLSDSRQKVLHAVAKRFNLLFLGYSGRDYFGAMTALFSCKPLPMYWVNHSSTGADTNAVVKNWVLKNGGVYIDADTANIAKAILSEFELKHTDLPSAGANLELDLYDKLSHSERLFALAHLYSRDRRSDKAIVYSSFQECDDLFRREKDADPVLHCRLLLQWARMLERFGRTPEVYNEAIGMLHKALTLVSESECVAVDVKVSLCDMEYCLTHTLGGLGIEFLPLIEMLIDQCTMFDDPVMLSRAYCTKARICQNSFMPKSAGYEEALDCYNLAAETLQPLGAQDLLPIIHFERFMLATAIGRGDEAAQAIISCLRGALLLADRPDAEWVQGILHYIFLYISDKRFKAKKKWIVSELALMGLDTNSIK